MFTDAAVVCITTYTMIAYSGRRSEDAEKVHLVLAPNPFASKLWRVLALHLTSLIPSCQLIFTVMQVMQQIQSREWGLILLDEVCSN
jgi:hypothetical protein